MMTRPRLLGLVSASSLVAACATFAPKVDVQAVFPSADRPLLSVGYVEDLALVPHPNEDYRIRLADGSVWLSARDPLLLFGNVVVVTSAATPYAAAYFEHDWTLVRRLQGAPFERPALRTDIIAYDGTTGTLEALDGSRWIVASEAERDDVSRWLLPVPVLLIDGGTLLLNLDRLRKVVVVRSRN